MKKFNNKNGTLYIIPTPIGNLNDITKRAIKIFKKVDIITTENIQHTNILLKKLKIKKKMFNMQIFNEKKQSKKIIKKLKQKKNIAIVSNAGTPLINDPGYYLIKLCYLNKIKIIPLPGPCAAITALIASGMSSNKFCYEGFLPKKKKKRIKIIKKIKKETRTTILYESPKRIIKCIKDIKKIMGNKKKITLAKELTKKWEKIKKNTTKNILKWLKKNKKNRKGEITIIIKGYKKKKKKKINKKIFKLFNILKKYLKFNKLIKIISKIYKIKKNKLYKKILKYRDKKI
ncbi:16S rRNA (cytidine(1402)-2'-O)-methyltransferase [Buchnera aphidicola]|uniref:16S rRNA (cytidine(1402)-2'-O)-methyltransferase n=1 Tax=Buchnera aphidicola TaxID=9 RepID=UPI0031B84E6E